MKRIARASIKTAAELEKEIERRQVAIDLLQDGPVKEKMRAEVAELRTYAGEQGWPLAARKAERP